MNGTRQTDRKARPGVILAAVLVSLLVVMMLGAALTKAVLLYHRQSRVAEQRQQSFWLAESAVQRAIHALGKSPDYKGETWKVPAEILGAGRSGVVTIRVEKTAEPRAGRRIHVEAQYPEDTVQRILFEREVVIEKAEP